MDSKRFIIGTLAGGIALFIVGYLMFSVALADFYRANTGSATGADRNPELIWATLSASVSYAALITFAMASRSAPTTLGMGTIVGAIVGFLLWFTADFVFYGTTNVANLTRTIVDPLLETVHGGIGGAVIAMVLERVPLAAIRSPVRA